MQSKIEYIEKNYKVNVGEFIGLYKDKIGRKDMSVTLGIGEHTVRSIASVLGLRLKQKHREADYQYFLKAQGKPVDKNLIDSLELIQKELYKTNKGLQRQKDVNNLLRKQLREAVREENATDILKESLKDLPIRTLEIEPIEIKPIVNAGGTTVIALSDLHIGALVEAYGVSNKFNFDIAEQRLKHIINKTITNPLVSDRLVITILGDVFQGLIHNSHLIGEMPAMEAVAKFSALFSEILLSLEKAFSKVEVYMISGNHERLTDDQMVYKKGYDLTYIFSEMLKANTRGYNRVYINYSLSGYNTFPLSQDIVHPLFGCIFHGDIDRTYRVDNLKSVMSVLYTFQQNGREPSLLLSGHVHQYKKALLPNGGVAISVGAFMGQDEYAKNKGYLEFPPSQVALYYNKYGELISEQVIIL